MSTLYRNQSRNYIIQDSNGAGLMNRLVYQLAKRTPAPEQPPKKEADPAYPHGRTFGKTILDDDQVRAARRMHEIDKKPAAEVAEHFGMTIDYTRKLLRYETRSRILI